MEEQLQTPAEAVPAATGESRPASPKAQPEESSRQQNPPPAQTREEQPTPPEPAPPEPAPPEPPRAEKEAQQALVRRQAEEQCRRWEAEAEEVRQVFPGFSLAQELANPEFRGLLSMGFAMERAYRTVHEEEILPALLSYTARQVEEKLTGSLLGGAYRPGENGAGGQAAAASRVDARSMDRSAFQALCRRVAGGERISLG